MPTNTHAPVTVKAVIEAAKFGRLIYVDDCHGRTSERIESMLNRLGLEQARQVSRELGLSDSDEEQVLRQRLVRMAGSDTAADLDKLFHAIAAVQEGRGEDAADHAAVDRFCIACQDLGAQHRLLTLTEWRAQEAKLVDEAKTLPTLFVFDDDFGLEGFGSNSGREAIVALAPRLAEVQYAVVLFTHKVGNNETAEALQAEIVVQSPELKDRLIVIAKAQLQEGSDVFVQRVKYSLLSSQWIKLRAAIKASLGDAQQAALQAIEHLRVEESERILVQTSMEEGAWFPETVLRVVLVRQEKEWQRRLRQNDDVHRLANSIEPMAGLRTRSSTGGIATAAFRLQREEVIDAAEHVNACHLPVRAGDVFKWRDKRYVVLAQPCDIAVRGDGVRTRDEQRMVPLAAVRAPKADAGGTREFVSRYPVQYLDDAPQEQWVDFYDVVYVPAWLLDLSVYSATGAVEMDSEGALPSRLPLSWSKRAEKLRERIGEQVVKKARAVATPAKPVTSDLLSLLIGLPPACRVKPALELRANGWSLKLPELSRFQRVRDRHAIALVTAFAAFCARMAFPHRLDSGVADDGPVAAPAGTDAPANPPVV